jgi:hypothetical protein
MQIWTRKVLVSPTIIPGCDDPTWIVEVARVPDIEPGQGITKDG